MKNWANQIYDHLLEINKIADWYSNPFANDGGGSRDCDELKKLTDKWIKHFDTWYSSIRPNTLLCKHCGKEMKYGYREEEVDMHTGEAWVKCKHCNSHNKIR